MMKILHKISNLVDLYQMDLDFNWWWLKNNNGSERVGSLKVYKKGPLVELSILNQSQERLESIKVQWVMDCQQKKISCNKNEVTRE